MISALFTSVADALISYAIDKLDPAERIKSWLRLDPARLAFKKALARAYSAFARQYPEYTSSLFDQSFLSTDALPELSKLLTRNQHPDPALLAQAWGGSLGAGVDFSQAATKPAAYFLERFEAELKAEPALQSIFDSRALESLPKLEAEIQKISTDLQRGLDEALKDANDYQKVILHIGGDVKNSNIVIGNDNNVINNYYYTGDFIALNEYYIPPDGVFQRVRVDEFIGRDWLTAKVDAFLNDPNRKSGAFLLIGDAGVGKTSFMAHLVKERRYLHLFAEQAPGQAMVTRALQSLESQLITRYQIDPYHDRDTLNVLADSPDFLERILRYAAEKLAVGEKIIIVCDALDEAGVGKNEFIFGLPKELPEGVYLILSQRPVNVKLPNFEPVIEKLEAQGEGNLLDIEAYLSAVAKRPEVAGQIRSKEYSEEFFILTLKEKSQGVWMYLHYIIKEIESGARAPLDLANLPTGLVGYYAEYWDAWRTGKRGKGEEAWDDLYAPLLTTLAAAQEAIPVDWLIQWADVITNPREVTRLLTEHWRAFITEKEVDGKKAYTPYHLSLKDFITGRVDTNKLPPAQANLVKDLAAQTVEAHKRIVSAFEKECNGEWEKLVEQDYPCLHLTAHMNNASEYEKLRMLLTEGDEKIKWAEAREKKEETYAGYLNDLTYIWDYTESKQNYALAIRCMLIESSIHSLASNMFPELLAQLCKTGLWSYTRCFAAIMENPISYERAGLLKSLIPELHSKKALLKAVDIIREIEDESDRASILTILFPHINEQDKAWVLEAVYEIKDDYERSRTITALAPYIKGITLWSQAIEVLRKINDEFDRASALANIMPFLNDELKSQTLLTTHNINDHYCRSLVLNSLLPYLVGDAQIQIAQEALSAIYKINNESDYVILLANLIPYLDEISKLKAFALARELKDEYWRAQFWVYLAPHLKGERKSEAIQEAIVAASKIEEGHNQALVLTSLAPHLNKTELLESVFEAVRKIKSSSDRIHFFELLVPHLTDDLKSQAMSEAFATMHEISDESECVHTLSVLAPYLDDFAIKQQALEIVQGFKVEENQPKALGLLIPFLDEEQKLNALLFAREITDIYFRVQAMAFVAPHLSSGLKTKVLSEALVTANAITHEGDLANVLVDLSPHLNTSALKSQALVLARKNKNASTFAFVLAKLSQYLSRQSKIQSLQEALSATRQIKDEDSHTIALAQIAPYLNDELKSRAYPEVLVAARKTNSTYRRIKALIFTAPHMKKEIQGQILSDALFMAHKITDQYWRVRALIDISKYLDEENKSQVIYEALVLTRKSKYIRTRALALAHLASYLSDNQQLLQEAIADANKIKDEADYILVLSELASHMNDGDLSQLLAAARQIYSGYTRAMALANLTPHLDHEEKIQILYEILDSLEIEALDKAFDTWKDIAYKDLQEKLHSFIRNASKKYRNDCVEITGILTPALVHFRGPEIADELYRTIKDVTHWWP